MLEASRQRLLDELDEHALVLDVGGWARLFARADWVIDLMPYESRGLYGYDQGGRDEERFRAGTWVQRDICAREPWPFEDGQFDFAICSHTLEDVRDPVWVCAELQRVARAGYIEAPSRLQEQTHGIQGPWVGWGHHHWLVETTRDPAAIEFVFKHHVLHGRRDLQLARNVYERLTPAERVQTLWWHGSFDAHERILAGEEEADAWLGAAVRQRGTAADGRGLRLRRSVQALRSARAR
jgi:hypothetical protein